MVEGIKMAAKAALIATITAAILALFAGVRIPNLDFTYFSQGLRTALAIGYHWCPALQVVFPVAVAMFGVYLSILLFHYAMIAVRWVMKINE